MSEANRFRFRGWDEPAKKMVTHQEMSDKDGYYAIGLERLTGDDVSGLIFMQSTGLVDANGVEIFEGDICYGGEYPDGTPREHIVVRWVKTPYTACFDFGRLPSLDRAEVIGNIYENPELMGAE